MTDQIPDVAQGTVNSRLAEFFKWAMREGPWEGSDLDGASVQEKAEELGLIVKTKYDSKTHGPSNWMFEDGDDYYVFAPDLAAQPPAAPVEKIGRTDREGGWNAGRDIAHQHSSAETGEQS